MKHLLTHFLIAFLLVFSLIATGCPQKNIDTVKKSSVKIATYANIGVNITRDLYRSNILSLDDKDRIADGFIALAKAGIAFDVAVVKVEQQYGTDAPPKAEIAKLFSVFDQEVVSRFIDVLKAVGVKAIPDQFKLVIETIRQAVLTISGVFGSRSIVANSIAKAGAI